MYNYKVEANVPLIKKGTKNALKYPWAEMKVGDSFFVPVGTNTTIYALGNSLYHSGRTWLLRHGLKHLTIAKRTATEDGVKGVRVWLVDREEA